MDKERAAADARIREQEARLMEQNREQMKTHAGQVLEMQANIKKDVRVGIE